MMNTVRRRQSINNEFGKNV